MKLVIDVPATGRRAWYRSIQQTGGGGAREGENRQRMACHLMLLSRREIVPVGSASSGTTRQKPPTTPSMGHPASSLDFADVSTTARGRGIGLETVVRAGAFAPCTMTSAAMAETNSAIGRRYRRKVLVVPMTLIRCLKKEGESLPTPFPLVPCHSFSSALSLFTSGERMSCGGMFWAPRI